MLLKPKRHELRCHGFLVHAFLLRMNNNVVDFSYANSHAIAYEIDKRNLQSVNHIPGIHDHGPRVTFDFNSVYQWSYRKETHHVIFKR